MWCAIDGFPDFEINEFGVVRNKKTKYVTSQRMNRGGYLYVQLSANGKNHVRLVHRLVAETFISNPDMLPLVIILMSAVCIIQLITWNGFPIKRIQIMELAMNESFVIEWILLMHMMTKEVLLLISRDRKSSCRERV